MVDPAPTEINPWAPGGSMSVDWVPGPPSTHEAATAQSDKLDRRESEPSAAGDDETAPTVTSIRFGSTETASRSPDSEGSPQSTAAARRPRMHVVAAVAAAVVVIGAIAVGVGSSRDTDVDGTDENTGATVAPSVFTQLDPPSDATVDEPDPAVPSVPISPTATSVGPISWVRVDGDDRSLPLRVEALAPGLLMGDGDTSSRWTSADSGMTWVRTSQVTMEREVGDIEWTVRFLDGETSLWHASDGSGLLRVDVDVAEAIGPRPDGFRVRTEVPGAGVPAAIGDDVFLPVTVRAELPWPEILGTPVGRAFRVEVDIDGRPIRAVSGDFHELSVTHLVLHEDETGRFELRDADDVAVWSFVAPAADSDLSMAHVITGRPITTWTRWDGEQFRRVDAPWGSTDRVDVAAASGGVVARAVSLDRRAHLWRSAVGVTWTSVRLPVEPTEGTPVTVYQGDEEVIVTAFDGDEPVSWATIDGVGFEELVRVPGVERRARGTFGWVAPPPRSEPQIRVSADGRSWEVVDLRTMLGLDDSRWDVDLDVTTVGSEIYVIAETPTGRTMLRGTVGAADCAGFDERCAVEDSSGEGELTGGASP